jgi:hypothetical protein
MMTGSCTNINLLQRWFCRILIVVLTAIGLICCDDYYVKYPGRILVVEPLAGSNLYVPVEKVRIEYDENVIYTNVRGEAILTGDTYDVEMMLLTKPGYRPLKLEIRDVSHETLVIERVQHGSDEQE